MESCQHPFRYPMWLLHHMSSRWHCATFQSPEVAHHCCDFAVIVLLFTHHLIMLCFYIDYGRFQYRRLAHVVGSHCTTREDCCTGGHLHCS